MFSVNKLSLWVTTGLFAVTTAFFNVYILLVSLLKYRERKQWSPSETIITALSAANVAHQLVCYFWMTMDEVDKGCRIISTPYTVMLLLVFSLKFAIMWDTSFLTFYYSSKLVSTPGRRRCCTHVLQDAVLKHVAPAVFLLVPLGGLGTCMPMLVVFHADNDTRANKDCGVLIPDTQPGRIYEAVYLVVTDVLPGAVMVKCCVSISAHLAVHLRNMRASTNGARGPKLGSQMRVIRMALSIVLIFALFLVVDLYVNYEIAVNHQNAITLTFLFTSVYTTTVATVLIYGKRTLWKALIHDFNVCLDEYPCLSCLKVPERKAKPSSPAKVKK